MVFRIEFERQDCSRCGGSGEFSKHPEFGTMCFKCSGTTKSLSPAGLRAKRAYEALLDERLSKDIREVVPGDVVYFEKDISGLVPRSGWYEIAESKKADDHYWTLVIAGKARANCSYYPGATIRVRDIEAIKETAREVVKRFKGATIIES